MNFNDHCLPLLCELHLFTCGLHPSLLLTSLHTFLHTNSSFPLSLTSWYLLGPLPMEPPFEQLILPSLASAVLHFFLEHSLCPPYPTFSWIIKVPCHFSKSIHFLFKNTIVLWCISPRCLLLSTFSLFLTCKHNPKPELK
jgi:hypothetical protein